MNTDSEVPLGSVATVTMGLSPKGATYNSHGDGLPLLNGPTEFGSIHPHVTLFTTDSKRECQVGDLIFCVRGSTTGRMNWADQRHSLGRGVCAIRGCSSSETKFIKYCLDLKLKELLQRAGGGTFPSLTTDSITSFRIPFPEDRQRIAGILTAYDDLIENNMRRIAILEEMARALYREWFVEFRFPGRERVGMVESEMGMVPEGWKVVQLYEAIDVSPPTKVPRENEKPFVPMASLSSNSMLIEGIEWRPGNSGSKFKNGDTLLARITPCLENGKTAFVQFLPDDQAVAFGSTEFIVLRAKTVCPEYTYLLARSDEFRDHAIKSMTGATGRQRVQERSVETFRVVLPDQQTVTDFGGLVAPLFRSAQLLADKNSILRRTRDLLLPKLISGEVDMSGSDTAELEDLAMEKQIS